MRGETVKDYMIGFSYVEFAKIQVRAESQEEAESQVFKILEELGMPDNAEVFDREYSIDCGEEVRQ
jgi:ABC-type polar amino acid transport system ATPase subunit